MIRPIPGLRVQWAIFSPKTNSYLSKLVTWILKLRDILRDPGVIFVAMGICETDSSPPLRLVGCFPTWPTFMGAAILNS